VNFVETVTLSEPYWLMHEKLLSGSVSQHTYIMHVSTSKYLNTSLDEVAMGHNVREEGEERRQLLE
jgi:hypothetical protein